MAKYKLLSVVPPGEYEVEIVGAYDCVSKNENEMMALKVRVKGHARIFFDHLVFSEASDWKIASYLISMGQEVADNEELDLRARDYIDRTARADVGVREFRGLKQNYIKKWLPPKSGAVEATKIPASMASTSGAMSNQFDATGTNEGAAR